MSIHTISLTELQNLDPDTIITFFRDTELGWFAYFQGNIRKCDESVSLLLAPVPGYPIDEKIEEGERYYYYVPGGGESLREPTYEGGSDPESGTVTHYGGKPGT